MAGTRAEHPNQGFLARAHKLAFYLAVLYGTVILVLAHPFIQRHVTYQHAFTEPWHSKHHIPEIYGLAPGKTLDTKIQTPDNETLGAWFILTDPYYHKTRSSSLLATQPSIETIEAAIQAYPTILYFHGAAGSRSTTWRLQHYTTWSARMQANIFVVDYRGFGDSTGTPSEDGLAVDGYAAWNWLMTRGADPQNVLVVGHSLGTGVCGKLGPRLAREGVRPRGIVLLAPFSSASTLIETFDVMGFPVLQPLQSFSWGRKLIKKLAHDVYDTLSSVREFNVPTLIAHSTDDMVVPHIHSRTLVDHLLNPLLPPAVELPSAPGTPVSDELFAAFTEAQTKRRAARAQLVRKVDIPNFGIIEEFDGTFGKVTYVEASYGTHSKVGLQEGVQDVIISMFNLGNTHRSD